MIKVNKRIFLEGEDPNLTCFFDKTFFSFFFEIGHLLN